MKILFVYNADSDFFSQAKDFIKKIKDPDDYKCDLCKITYGKVKMKKEWREFLENLQIKTEFLHKDEFEDRYSGKKKINLPTILRVDENQLDVLVSSEEMKEMERVDELKEAVKNSLKSFN